MRPEVGAWIGLPVAVAELLVVPTAGEGQRLDAVELLAPRLQRQPGVQVAGGELDAQLDATDLVDDPLEA